MELNFPGRLLIQKVILRNFKSYAGETIIGPFHKNFTSVVGPNGSGKSNLLESLLFAFGKRAKKMRLKKLSELIHHSNLYPNFTEASVEVHFVNILDHEEDFEIVPESNLILTRIVHKNSTSEYRLNNRQSTFEEVTRVLKGRGIDLEHNRFLILQGEVEQIAMMKPKSDARDDSRSGLLEYLEEIIGTDVYVSDIEKAEKELEEIGDKVASTKLRFEESKKVLQTLEQPMKEAVSFIELEKELFCFKSLQARLEIFQRESQKEVVLEGLQGHERRLKELDEMYEQKKKDNEEAIKEYTIKAEEVNALKKKIKSIEDKIKKIVDGDVKEMEAIKQLRTSIKDAEKEVDVNIRRCGDIKDEIEKANAALPAMEKELADLRALREDIDQRYTKVKAETDSATETLQKEKNALELELNPYKKDFTMCKADKEAKQQELTTLLEDLQNNDTEKIKVSAALERLTAQQKTLHAEFQTLSTAAAQVKTALEAANKAAEKIHNTATDNRTKADSIQMKISQIENQEKRSYENKTQLGEIMRAKMSGALNGICGRLGDLGSIPLIYDVPISSVCGRLDNIVVEKIEDGSRLLDFCRERKIGRVNVIALDKIGVNRERMMNFKSPDPKAVRLFDQITPSEERFKTAFYFAVSDTLYTETLEDARRIGLSGQRFKVVDKNGNIIDPSGEMRGFANPSKGKMKTGGNRNEIQSSADLETLKQELKGLQEASVKLSGDKQKADQELVRLQNLDRTTKQELRAKQNELQLCTDDLESSKNRFRVLEGRSISDLMGRRQELEMIVQKMSEKLEKTGRLIEQKMRGVTEIEKKIEAVAGNEFTELKKELLRVTNQEEKCETELIKSKIKLQQKAKDLEKYSKTKEKAEADVVNLKTELEKLTEKRKQRSEKASKLAEEHKAESAKYAQSESLIKDLEKQKEAIKNEFDEILKFREEVKTQIKNLNAQHKVLQNEIQIWQTKLDHIIAEAVQHQNENSDLMQDMQVESTQAVENLEHQSRRSKSAEDRANFRRPVQWDASKEELAALVCRLGIIGEIEKSLEQELSLSNPNLNVIAEYKLKKNDKAEKEEAFNQVKQNETNLRNLYIELKNKRFTEFNRGFREISEKLREMYNLLTRGGSAELEFADSTDPFSEGIVFTVRPPSKSWKKMANLSGGEKTLSSLALVFALHHYKPNALYVMDEVDAALDFQNVGTIANYIKGETQNAQFIVVSLRYQMFEVADQLVGIYKIKDVSHSLSITPASLKSMPTENKIIKQTIENISVKRN